jgi:hypothetical protein
MGLLLRLLRGARGPAAEEDLLLLLLLQPPARGQAQTTRAAPPGPPPRPRPCPLPVPLVLLPPHPPFPCELAFKERGLLRGRARLQVRLERRRAHPWPDEAPLHAPERVPLHLHPRQEGEEAEPRGEDVQVVVAHVERRQPRAPAELVGQARELVVGDVEDGEAWADEGGRVERRESVEAEVDLREGRRARREARPDSELVLADVEVDEGGEALEGVGEAGEAAPGRPQRAEAGARSERLGKRLEPRVPGDVQLEERRGAQAEVLREVAEVVVGEREELEAREGPERGGGSPPGPGEGGEAVRPGVEEDEGRGEDAREVGEGVPRDVEVLEGAEVREVVGEVREGVALQLENLEGLLEGREDGRGEGRDLVEGDVDRTNRVHQPPLVHDSAPRQHGLFREGLQSAVREAQDPATRCRVVGRIPVAGTASRTRVRSRGSRCIQHGLSDRGTLGRATAAANDPGGRRHLEEGGRGREGGGEGGREERGRRGKRIYLDGGGFEEACRWSRTHASPCACEQGVRKGRMGPGKVVAWVGDAWR